MSVRTVLALGRLTRFWNLSIIAVAQYFTAFFLVPLSFSAFVDVRLFILSLSSVSIAAAGYVINDYYDIKIDLINKPTRVVIGKSITRRYAILIHVVISSIGILLGFLISWKIGIVNLLCVFLLWWYSNRLKRQVLVGNFAVALLTGCSIAVVMLLLERTNTLIVIYSLFAFFITLVREIVKDIDAVKGDINFGSKTLPIVWGIRKTKRLLYVLTFAFTVAVLIVNMRYLLMPLFYLFLFFLLPMLFLIFRLVGADTKKEFFELSQLCKLIMLLGIVSMTFI